MFATGGYIHLPYDLEFDLTSEPAQSPYQINLASTLNLPSFKPTGESLSLSGSGRDGIALKKQLKAQYGTPAKDPAYIAAARTQDILILHKHADFQQKAAVVHQLKENNKLYLKLDQSYDLSRWSSYGETVLTYKNLQAIQLEDLFRTTAPANLQELIAQIETRYRLFEQLYLRLPRLQKTKDKAGYAKAFLMLTDSVLSGLRKALRDENSER